MFSGYGNVPFAPLSPAALKAGWVSGVDLWINKAGKAGGA
jgi:hypothetical protein